MTSSARASKVGRAEPVRDLAAQYAGEWLLLQVTQDDGHGTPLEGILLKHSKSHAAVCGALTKAGASGHPSRLYLLAGFPRLQSGHEVRQALAKSDEGEAGGWRRW